MREPKVAKGEPPQQPICVLNIVLPETIIKDAMQKKLKGMLTEYSLIKEEKYARRISSRNHLFFSKICNKIITNNNLNFNTATSKLFIYFMLRLNNL